MKLAICNETFENLDWANTCRLTAGIGYDGIEIAPFTLAKDIRNLGPDDRASIRATALQYGLEVVGLHWLLVSPDGLSLTAPHPETRHLTATYLADLVDLCSDLGGKILVLGSPKQRRIPEGETAEVATSRLIEGLEPALARCQVHDITLCLEPLPPPEADLILTLADATAVTTQRNHPHLRTILDVKSATSDTAPIPDLIGKYAADIAHFHANDANRRGPGTGATDFVPILKALSHINYSGYISVEVFDYTPDPETIARESIAYLKSCITQL